MGETYRDLFVTSGDGLKLYARDYGPRVSRELPVVCLSGLARTSADFHDLAVQLSGDPARPRRVLALDYRGRGRSDWATDWRLYDARVELEDVLQVLAVAGIERAVFVGTSRGGLITMGLSAIRPALIAGAVLNDIGPVIDGRGLVRIRGYVGKLPTPRTMREAAEILKGIMGIGFPKLMDEQWEAMARGTWQETDGRLRLAYDPKLMQTLESIDLETPLPVLWPLFEGLKNIPVLSLRGANSDILSAETQKQMQAAHERLRAVTVTDQGHAPLIEGDVLTVVAQFIAHVS